MIDWLGLVIVVFPGHVVNLFYTYSTLTMYPYICTISRYTLTLQYPWHFLPSSLRARLSDRLAMLGGSSFSWSCS